MQSYGSTPQRNTSMASPAPMREPTPAVPALFKGPALQGVSLPNGAPQAQPGEYCKPVQGFTSSGLITAKV